MSESTEQKDQGHHIPAWLTVAVVLLCLLGGAYLVWWFARDKPPQDIALSDNVTTAPSPRLRFGNRPTPQPEGDGISLRRDRDWRVRAGHVRMDVGQDRRDNKYSSSLRYTDVPTPEQWEVLSVRLRIMGDKAVRDHLKVDDDQMKQLRAMGDSAYMAIDSATRTALDDKFKAWRAADDSKKAAIEKDLVKMLADAGAKALEPTKKIVAERTAKVRSILTAEQFKAFADMGRQSPTPPPGRNPGPAQTQPVRPTPPPATRPAIVPATRPAVVPATRPAVVPVTPPAIVPVLKLPPATQTVPPPATRPATGPATLPAK